jgi:prohibitin 2
MGRFDKDDDDEMSWIKKMVLLIIGIIFVITIVAILMDGLEVIPAGHKGVITNSPGGPSMEEINEGYQWSTAYIWADVDVVEYRTQTVSFIGTDDGPDTHGSIQIITNDSVPIFLDLSVVYHVQDDRVSDLIIENGQNYKDRVIYPYVRSIARDVASQYQALDVIGEKRGAIEIAIAEGIRVKMVEKYIVVEGVPLRDIRIPAALEQSVISKKVAEQSVLTAQYLLEAQMFIANKTIVDAQANATSAVLISQGDANATVIRAIGQAEALRLIMMALNSTEDNATRDLLTYQYLQVMRDPSSNIKFIIVPSDGVPIILNTSDTSG